MVKPNNFVLMVNCIGFSLDRSGLHPELVAGIAGRDAVHLDGLHAAVAAIAVKIEALHKADGAGSTGHHGLHSLGAAYFFGRGSGLSVEGGRDEILPEVSVVHAADD